MTGATRKEDVSTRPLGADTRCNRLKIAALWTVRTTGINQASSQKKRMKLPTGKLNSNWCFWIRKAAFEGVRCLFR